MTKHTFVILAYKESTHLQECIDSLKKQNTQSDIILCTSTPSAFLEDICKNNDLRLCINPKKEGIVCDWNFALKKAQSSYVTLTHQDDLYNPYYAHEIIQAAETRKDALIIFSNYDELICNDDQICIRKKSLNFIVKNSMLKLFFGNKNYKTNNKHRLLALGNPIGCPTVTFNKNMLGNFEFDKKFSINLDWKAWHDLSQKEGSFVWINKTLVSHRIYDGSETSHGLAENRRQTEDLIMFKKIWPSVLASILSKIYSLSYKNNQ